VHNVAQRQSGLGGAAVEHFREKWNPVLGPKMRQCKNAGAVSVTRLRKTALLLVSVLACISVAISASPARAQAPAICGTGATDSWIAACGAIIDNPRESLQNRVQALKFRGLAHYRGGDIASAAADFAAATTLAPDDPEGWINLGMMRQSRGDLDGAVADYDKAIGLDPSSWVAHVNRGNALRLRRDPAGAIAEYDVTLGLKPDLNSALRGRAIARQMQGDLHGAIADASAALRIEPHDAEALMVRGTAFRLLGDTDKALADYEEATRAAPDQAGAWLDRGALLMERGSMEAAIESFDKTIALNPRSIEAYNNRGAAESQNGDFTRAAADLDTALRLGPSHEGAYGNRGFVRLALGDFAGAAADFSALASRNPGDPYRVLWRHLARLRAGVADDGFAREATTLGSGPWPGPLLALFAGALDRATVTTQGMQVEPSQLAERQCELQFYVAEFALATNDPATAAPLLREAVASCPVGLLERAGAIGELKRLQP
jgi:tetratricopeptide (TPR) repeat protein